MKKPLFLFLLSFLLLCTLNSNADEYDFRDTKWGMTRAQVKASEKGEPIHDEDRLLVYKGKILDKSCDIVYIFVDNKLIRAKYFLTVEHTYKNKYIQDYDDLKSALINKYGKPVDDRISWQNDLYKNDPSNWGMAVAVGHVSYFSKWETETTEILNVLMGDNYEISSGIEYSSRKLYELEKKADEKKALNDL
jgi:hypothetical protein